MGCLEAVLQYKLPPPLVLVWCIFKLKKKNQTTPNQKGKNRKEVFLCN